MILCIRPPGNLLGPQHMDWDALKQNHAVLSNTIERNGRENF